MRILALVTDAFGGYGGIAQYNRDLLSALARSNYVNDVVVLPRVAGKDVGGVPKKVMQLAPRSMRSAYVAAAISATNRHGPFDAIFNGHLYHAPLASVLGRWMKVPVWLQTHGIDAWQCPNRIIRSATEQSTLITTVSRYTRARMLGWCNLQPDKIRVLPNTFRPMFASGPKDEAYLAQLGLVDRLIILTVARLERSDVYKGHHKIIRSLPAVRQKHPNTTYVIVGGGSLQADLERDVAGRGLGSAVKFLGRLSDDELLKLYRAASVFAMPSTKEGFGIVFVEAAAAGLPVIGGNRDGSVDALADGIIGAVINPDDDDALVEALDAALSGHLKANPAAVQRFAFDNFAHHVDDLVRSLVR